MSETQEKSPRSVNVKQPKDEEFREAKPCRALAQLLLSFPGGFLEGGLPEGRRGKATRAGEDFHSNLEIVPLLFNSR